MHERLLAKHALFWIQLFVLTQVVCQIALLFGAIGQLRILVRGLSFGGSLLLFVLISGKEKQHPALPWVMAVLAIIGLNIFHPTTNTFLAAIAQVMLYFAILSPLFWVSRLNVTSNTLTRILLLLWVFHTVSATLGVLQTYFPGRFQPSVSTTVMGMGKMAEGLKIELANGEKVWRPMGLTDMPGGAGTAGMYAFLFGLGFLFYWKSWPMRAASIASLGIGLCCIYLTQIRSLLIMSLICAVVFGFILFRRGELQKLIGVILLVPAVVVGSFIWAISVGGESTSDRFASLTSKRADKVYYENRGGFLERTVTKHLPEYPVGAGLGRWGMMHHYFGDEYDPDSPPIWAEIQWTGWLFDGGIPLIVTYFGALLVTCWVSYQIAISRLPGQVPIWGALMLAYNIGVLAITFNYPIFVSQSGTEFWMLNATLFGAAVSAKRQLQNERQGFSQNSVSPAGQTDQR